MAYNQPTKSQKETKLLKLMRFKNEIEFDNNPDRVMHAHPESKEHMAKWRTFSALSKDEQIKLLDAWKRYYELVKESPIFDLFQEQRKASNFTKIYALPIEEQPKLIRMRWERIKELGKQAHEMRENGDLNTVQKPSSIDPWEFNHGWVKAYQDTEQAIKELQAELSINESEDTQGVWS